MKKQILATLIVVASLMLSCSAPQNIITGNLKGLEKGDKIYLVIEDYGETLTIVDSVTIDIDENFRIETSITDINSQIFVVKKGKKLDLKNDNMRLFIEGFSTMSIDGDISEGIRDIRYSKVSGGFYASPGMVEANKLVGLERDLFKACWKKYDTYNALLKSNSISKDSLTQLKKEADEVYDKAYKTTLRIDSIKDVFRKNNPDAAYSAHILKYDYYAMLKGVNHYDSLYNQLSPRAKATADGKSTAKYISTLKRTAIGAPAPEIKGKDIINGDNIALSDYKGKYVLIEFWNKNCGGCIQSIPYLIETYEKLKGENFEFIAIANGEKDEKALIENINKKKLTWKHINDTDGAISEAYGVLGVPECFLIDPQGAIVVKGHPISIHKKVMKIVLENK